MKSAHEKLSEVELEISNMLIFINQCMERLPVKIAEHRELQKEIYVRDGIEKANIYANFEG